MRMRHDRVRRSIARQSPKEFSKQIVSRNRELLKILNEWYKALKKGQYYNGRRGVKIGCPHCVFPHDCQKCLWTDVIEKANRKNFTVRGKNSEGQEIWDQDGDYGCIYIKFGRVSMTDLDLDLDLGKNPEIDAKGFEVNYRTDGGAISCNVSYYSYHKKEIDATYKRCKRFLEGHIKWAKSSEWGKDSAFYLQKYGDRWLMRR